MALRGGLGVVHRECLLVRASALTHGADHYRDWGSGVLALAQTGLAKIPGSYRSSKPLGLSSDRCMLTSTHWFSGILSFDPFPSSHLLNSSIMGGVQLLSICPGVYLPSRSIW